MEPPAKRIKENDNNEEIIFLFPLPTPNDYFVIDGQRSQNSNYMFYKPASMKLGEDAMEMFVKTMCKHEPWREFIELSNKGMPPKFASFTFVDDRFYVLEKATNTAFKIENIQITRFDYPTNIEVLVTWPAKLKPDNYSNEHEEEPNKEQLLEMIEAEKQKTAKLEEQLAESKLEDNREGFEASLDFGYKTRYNWGRRETLNELLRQLDEREEEIRRRERELGM